MIVTQKTIAKLDHKYSEWTLVKEPTPEELAKKIKETVENTEYYEVLKENLKKEKDNIFSVETYCDILLKEYAKLVKR